MREEDADKRAGMSERIGKAGDGIAEDTDLARQTRTARDEHAGAKALMNRAMICGESRNLQGVIDNCSMILDLHDIPSFVFMDALYLRGCTFGDLGRIEAAIEDFADIIGMRDTPPERVADALIRRAGMYRRFGELHLARKDLKRVIEMRAASDALKDAASEALLDLQDTPSTRDDASLADSEQSGGDDELHRLLKQLPEKDRRAIERLGYELDRLED